MPHDIKDVYSRVTARIIADLEQGVRPWMKPWSGNMPPAGSLARFATTASRIRGQSVGCYADNAAIINQRQPRRR